MVKLLIFLRFSKNYEKCLDPLVNTYCVSKLNIYKDYIIFFYFYSKKTSNPLHSWKYSWCSISHMSSKKNYVAGWELFFFFFVWIYEHTHFSFSQYIVYRTNENIDIIMYEGIDTSVLVSLYDFYIFFFALFMKFLFVCLFSKRNFTLEFPKTQKFSVDQNLPLLFFLLFYCKHQFLIINGIPISVNFRMTFWFLEFSKKTNAKIWWISALESKKCLIKAFYNRYFK